MPTIASSSRTQPAPQAGRASRLVALIFGVVVGALAAIVGGLLLALLGLPSDGWPGLALMLVSVGAGGWIAARRLAGTGWRSGLYVGLLLAVLTLLVTLAGGDNLSVAGIVVVCMACSAAGAAGGWLARGIVWRRSRV